MTEHIYAEQVLSSKRYGDGVVESVVRPCGERREEVVRCRDCAHAHEGARYCDRFTGCGLSDFVDVKPDGFCAWGERREDGK